ncbi:MAG: hypothetical protein OXF50_06785 [Caldilineaceae bacterium]|nr:hypothetical protein [Caldilineaceae bacterium]
MARRSRRRRHSPSKANPRSFSELRANREHEDVPTPATRVQNEPKASEPSGRSAPGQAGRGQADWNVEYSRVFSDLKQLLIVSVALFALMLVVGLFL